MERGLIDVVPGITRYASNSGLNDPHKDYDTYFATGCCIYAYTPLINVIHFYKIQCPNSFFTTRFDVRQIGSVKLSALSIFPIAYQGFLDIT